MSELKQFGLVLLAGGMTLAFGGCAGGTLAPWLIGAGLVSLLSQQTG